MDKQKMESLWPDIVVSISKMESGEFLNQQELDACLGFLGEIQSLASYMNDNLPRQIFGRSYRKEGDKFILDDNGEYVSMRGILGATWYRPKNWTPTPARGAKWIGPFGG